MFGGSSGTTSAYKYDVLEDKYTQLTNIPYAFYCGSVVAVGTDVNLFGSGTVGTNVYLFGSDYSYSYHRYTYRYDLSENKYTKLENIPYNFYAGSAILVNSYVYLMGTKYSGESKLMYKLSLLKREIESDELIVVTDMYNAKHKPITIGKLKLNLSVKQAYQLDGKLLNIVPAYLTNGSSWTKAN